MDDRLSNPLRLWRVRHGYTLDEVAGLTGYSEAMISLIERGKRNPSPAARIQIARCLGAHVSELFDPEPALSEEEATA
jgi:transcriptional regulator with XRE-family HTH domain